MVALKFGRIEGTYVSELYLHSTLSSFISAKCVLSWTRLFGYTVLAKFKSICVPVQRGLAEEHVQALLVLDQRMPGQPVDKLLNPSFQSNCSHI